MNEETVEHFQDMQDRAEQEIKQLQAELNVVRDNLSACLTVVANIARETQFGLSATFLREETARMQRLKTDIRDAADPISQGRIYRQYVRGGNHQ